MAGADPETSSRIFISYRREDSSGHVLALLPALRSHFGADRIFKDTDKFRPGRISSSSSRTSSNRAPCSSPSSGESG